MWKMLQQKKADDYVIATGKTYSVKDFINLTLNELKFNYKWIGKGTDQKVINLDNKKTLVKIDKKYFRPSEVDLLIGDASKARKKLKWKPSVNLKKLVNIMVNHDLNESLN